MNVLNKLIDGNNLYVTTNKYNGEVNETLRFNNLNNGQHPYAIILTCSDSRVIPEAIFSASLGELFVIRVAGNVVLESEIASIEYAYEHLHCENIVILGHTNCGAIDSAIKSISRTGNIIVDTIKNIIKDEKDANKACKDNVLNSEKIIKERFPKINVIKGVYDIGRGLVTFIE